MLNQSGLRIHQIFNNGVNMLFQSSFRFLCLKFFQFFQCDSNHYLKHSHFFHDQKVWMSLCMILNLNLCYICSVWNKILHFSCLNRIFSFIAQIILLGKHHHLLKTAYCLLILWYFYLKFRFNYKSEHPNLLCAHQNLKSLSI